MAEIKRFQTNPRMSGAVVHGGVVSLSGQVAIDHRGGTVANQAREVLERIDLLLADAGTDKSKLLTANLYLTDIASLQALNMAWDRWVVPGCAPTRTTIQAVLASPDYALEIAVTAAVD
ncbi:RidA family protein [Sphingomonas sp. KR3-1]|uniref:RidA family protein n=1 Tax=Sphingomonas sp. KR3-1 TaxID=3156611 RepID=UPI0032B6042E